MTEIPSAIDPNNFSSKARLGRAQSEVSLIYRRAAAIVVGISERKGSSSRPLVWVFGPVQDPKDNDLVLFGDVEDAVGEAPQ